MPNVTAGSLQKNLVLQILLNQLHILWPSKIAPVVFVGAKSEDVLSIGSEAQIGRDDGERAVFRQHCKKPRRNNVDAGKSQRPRGRCLCGDGRLVRSPPAKPKLLIE